MKTGSLDSLDTVLKHFDPRLLVSIVSLVLVKLKRKRKCCHQCRDTILGILLLRSA